jgi:hypothetical protein
MTIRSKATLVKKIGSSLIQEQELGLACSFCPDYATLLWINKSIVYKKDKSSDQGLSLNRSQRRAALLDTTP